ncbi:MAG TPA: hypothetical protein DER23_07070 [Clostridiales bacterium]|jgi:hypothetical protein|nr:hypothetical protein [Clostridiales bacterium]HCG36087.1 hypothetical protein [Clostridiales bacterium]
MLKIYEALKSVLFTTFATFSLLSYTFFMLALSTSEANLGPTSKLLNCILVYAVLQGICTLIHRWNIASGIRRLIHFVLSLLCFSIVFIMIGGYISNAARVLAVIGGFMMIYVMLTSVLSLLHFVINRQKNKTLEYDFFVKENDKKEDN